MASEWVVRGPVYGSCRHLMHLSKRVLSGSLDWTCNGHIVLRPKYSTWTLQIVISPRKQMLLDFMFVQSSFLCSDDCLQTQLDIAIEADSFPS